MDGPLFFDRDFLNSRREGIHWGSYSSHSGEAGSAGLIDWMRAARYSKHLRSKAARHRAVSSLTR